MGPNRERSRALSRPRNGKRARSILLAPFLCLMMVLSVPLGPVTALPDDGSSRTLTVCSGAEPPPKEEDGIRHGDWDIWCPPDEPVNLTNERMKIQGNITVKAGTVLRISMNGKLQQIFSQDERYLFDVQEGASLIIEKNSELLVDTFKARSFSDVSIDDSKLTTGGYLQANSQVLKMTDSYIKNKAFDANPASNGAEAYLILNSTMASFHGSTIISSGGIGGHGDEPRPAGVGGGSYGYIFAGGGVLNNVDVEVSGGDGGTGMDSYTGDGTNGGMGGEAQLQVLTPEGINHIISGVALTITGGAGGEGGNGAMSATVPGGNGGRGEAGGRATLVLGGTNIEIRDSEVQVGGGDGGKGGTGGESSGSAGGHGGNAGKGGDSLAHVQSDGPIRMTDTNLQVLGGQGADGGFFGFGAEIFGNAGNAGRGGDASLIMEIDGSYRASNTSAEAIGGHGGRGGFGALVSGDGGDGGDALCQVNTTGTFDHMGHVGRISRFGAVGGDGGWGGDAVGSGGTGGGLKGRGGDAGSSETTINSSWSIDFGHSHIEAFRANGGEGGKGGSPGFSKILMQTARFNSTDSLADWTIEGLLENGKGIMRNTTVDAPMRAFVKADNIGASFDILWDVDVCVSDAIPEETWEVEVYKGKKDEGLLEYKASVTGSTDLASFVLLGEYVDHAGSFLYNYTTMARLPGTLLETKQVNFALTQNRVIDLDPATLPYTPHINITSPEENNVIKSWKMAPCRHPTPTDIAKGVSPPGCLKLEGRAWVEDRDDEGVIKDVMLILSHEDMGTFIFRRNTIPSVDLENPDTMLTDWSFGWEVGAYDFNSYSWEWPEGDYTIEVKAYNGVVWSDEIDGPTVKIKVYLEHRVVPLPPPDIDAGNLQAVDYEYYESGVKVKFSDAKIVDVHESQKIIRMEWDYNNDGITDWSHIPSDCDYGTTCEVPVTEYVYEDQGYINPKFCVVTSAGITKCDEKKIVVNRNPKPVASPVSGEALLVTTILIVCMCSVITMGLIIASLSEATKFAIMAFILIPLYTRLKKEETLDNYTRGEIRGYIVANPGTHYSRIKRDLGLNNGALIYHLRTLEREGFIYSHRDDYYRRFYPRGRKPRPGPNLTTVQESIIEVLLDEPNLTARQVAKKLDKSRKVVNYHLVWLRRWGLVETKKGKKGKVYNVIYEDEVEREQDTFNGEVKGDSKP